MKKSSYKLGAELLSAMANEKRLQILILLSNREVVVGEIAEIVNLTQSAVSQHLKILRMAGLIQSRRSKQSIYYYDPARSVRQILEIVAAKEIVQDTDAGGPSGLLGKN